MAGISKTTTRQASAQPDATRQSGMHGQAPIPEHIMRISPASTFETLQVRFSAVAALIGYDQRTPFHSLTADVHTKEVARNLAREPVFSELGFDEKIWAILAAHLHDIGKAHSDGRQETPGSARVIYAGHEEVSARIAREDILPHLDMDEKGKEFVLAIIENHGIAFRLIEAYKNTDEPRGSGLRAYEKFVSVADGMEGSRTPEGRMRNLRLLLAFGRADESAAVNEQTAAKNPDLISKTQLECGIIDRLESALPAIIEAVEQKRSGRPQAGIERTPAGYVYKDYGAQEAKPYDTKALSRAFQEHGISGKAMGILLKSNEDELPSALGKAGFSEPQILQIVELAARYKV